MASVTIIISGKPFAKQRPRVTKFGTYTPKETVSFERVVGQLAAREIKQPFAGPVKLTVQAVFELPASWSQKKRMAALGTCHIQRPDLDNIEKAVSDGLNRIAFNDDSQIADKASSKRWGLEAQTIVTIEELGL